MGIRAFLLMHAREAPIIITRFHASQERVNYSPISGPGCAYLIFDIEMMNRPLYAGRLDFTPRQIFGFASFDTL